MACRPAHRSLSICCERCDCPVEVTYEPAGNQDTLLSAEYHCPLCAQLNSLRIAGRVVSVADRPAREEEGGTRKPD